MTVGVIDVGTNSVRVLITDGTGMGERDMVITRLGQGVDTAGRHAPEAIQRTRAAIATFAGRCRDAGVDRLRIIGTSAVRDATDRDVLLDLVASDTGVAMDVLSGDQEARLVFAGASSALDGDGPFLVCDIGGGSTELIVGARMPERAVSLDIGSVRLTERHIASDPPSQAEVVAAAADARGALATVDLSGADSMVGVAGTITTVCAIALRLETYDRERVHGATLSIEDITRVRDRLTGLTIAERAAIPVMPSGREDVIVAGCIIFAEVMSAAGMDRCIVSESDILDGAAREMLDQASPPGTSPR